MRPFLRQSEQFTWRMSALEPSELPDASGALAQHKFQGMHMRVLDDGQGVYPAHVRAYVNSDDPTDGHIGEMTWDNKWEGTVDRVKTHPAHREKGVATALYDYATALAAEQPDRYITPTTAGSEYASDEGRAWGHKMLQRSLPAGEDVSDYDLEEDDEFDGDDGEGGYEPPALPVSAPETEQDEMDRYIRPWYDRPNWSPDEPSPYPPDVEQEYRKRYRPEYQERQANSRLAAVNQEMVDGLNTEFHDWAKENLPVSFSEGWDYTKPMGGPLNYWDNIEEFFQDKYPEAHRGFNMAEEKARPLMDTGYNSWGGGRPYETGPEAVEKYGYDPRQLAAGFMYLHTWSHAQSPQNQWRGDKLPRDIDRLADIFQRRTQMQQDHRQKQQAPQPITARLAAFNDELVNRLDGEFHEWAGQQDDPYGNQAPNSWNGRGPIGNWINIEQFLKDKYPAAHKGFSVGMERAGPMLDRGPNPWSTRAETPYATGPEAVTQYGYDPAEVAAGMLLLHNQSSPLRGHVLPQDQARLNDIFDKRQKMQRDYEQKQQVPQPITAALKLLQHLRIAMPVYYHVTPSQNRDSILEHGLDYTRGEHQWGNTPGNYFWENGDDAQEYADDMTQMALDDGGYDEDDEPGYTVLPFTHHGPVMDDLEGNHELARGRSFYTTDPIPGSAFKKMILPGHE